MGRAEFPRRRREINDFDKVGGADSEEYGSWPVDFDEAGSAELLLPHRAEPRVSFMKSPPRIALSFEAFRDTQLIIESAGANEVGWLGVVRENEEAGLFVIERVFLFRQRVSMGHCEFDAEDLGAFWTEQLARDPGAAEWLNRILFWGHLHPGDMVGPSGQDEAQMELFSHNPYFIRGIFTREGECRFTFFDYARGLKIIDCPWKIIFGHDDRRKEIAAELREKVRKGK